MPASEVELERFEVPHFWEPVNGVLIDGSGSMVDELFLKEETDETTSIIAGSLNKLWCVSD